jgi:hypothetical protein
LSCRTSALLYFFCFFVKKKKHTPIGVQILFQKQETSKVELFASQQCEGKWGRVTICRNGIVTIDWATLTVKLCCPCRLAAGEAIQAGSPRIQLTDNRPYPTNPWGAGPGQYMPGVVQTCKTLGQDTLGNVMTVCPCQSHKSCTIIIDWPRRSFGQLAMAHCQLITAWA